MRQHEPHVKAHARESQQPLAELIDVSVAFGDTAVLTDFRLTVNGGDIAVFTGPNGAGKTTALRLLAGVVSPDSGTVFVHGEPPDDRRTSFRQSVAIHIEEPLFADHLTVREQLIMVGVSWGMIAGEASNKAMAYLEHFDSVSLATRFPHELSSGQRQTCALVMTRMRPSQLMLLDEPERRLDDHRLSRLNETLREYVAQGGTLVVATHHQRLMTNLKGIVHRFPGRHGSPHDVV